MKIGVVTPKDLDYFSHLSPVRLTQALPEDTLLVGCVEDSAPPVAAGILMAHAEESMVVVDWLYVDEAFRRRGGGRAMLELLLQNARASGILKGVSVFFADDDENMPAFLAACGFGVSQRGGSAGFAIRLGDFPYIPAFGPTKGSIVPLEEIPEAERVRFAALLDSAAIPGIAVPTPFSFRAYRPESCVCLEDGIIRAICLLRGDENGLSIDWIYSNTAPPAIIRTINESVSRLKGAFPADTTLAFASVNKDLENVIKRYLPAAQRSETHFALCQFQ